MQARPRRALIVVTALILGLASFPSVAKAGTTGEVAGRVRESISQAPVAGARVTATSPSQSTTAVTDAAGNFVFVSLAPDTYTLTVSRQGYDSTSQTGVTVLADQTQRVALALVKQVATLGTINVRSASELVRPGTTSDVYSVNGVGQEAAHALAGAGNLNQAYSAMAAVPGVNVPQGQQGWYQPVYIRGGDLDQVGWELDGIPVNRSYDNAPMSFVSSLGQQELQVYTGGSLASADASGIAGYVNQVIKRGTSPGFGTLDLAVGAPTFYNKASLEVGGATPDQRFSYYLGTLAADQGFRYINQFNGANEPGFFYPLTVSQFAPGPSYGIASTRDRETVANVHFALPHGRNGNADDIQLLYQISQLNAAYYSSLNDLGGESVVANSQNGGAPIPWSDTLVYSGTVFAPPDPNAVIRYFSPSAQLHPYQGPLPSSLRETNTNAFSVFKLQYQRNFSSSSYLRIFGYGLYSNWFIHGPVSSFLLFGGEIGDYELPVHTHGVTVDYANQLSAKHLLTLSGFYSTSFGQRYTTTNGFPGGLRPISNDVDGNGNCYDMTGAISSCFNSANRGTFAAPQPYPAAPGTQWLVTENGYRANFSKANPVFSAASVNDSWKPTDRLTINLGLRAENYRIRLNDDTVAGYPARAFWFAAYNREFCFGPGYFQPMQKLNGPSDSCAADFPLSSAVHLANVNAGAFSHTVMQPRFGFTFLADADNVVRGSYGVYARPASTREADWNRVDQNLAAFLGTNFAAYGYPTPNHDVRPDRSANYDLSLEHHFKGTDASFKVTPFYRSTQDQVQQLIINALTGLFGSLNVGHQVSTGVELAVQKGNFAKDGLAFQLAYTHTRSRIRYNNFPNGRNVIDNLNIYIQQYNSYTKGCVGAAPSSDAGSRCGVFGGGTAVAVEPNGAANPYFNAISQPLFDRNAEYTTYDLIPQPFAAANGYEVPNVASLVVNFKHRNLAVTPSFTYSSGASYGSPLSWPGYQPDTCPPPTDNAFDCASYPGLLIPDAYTGRYDNLGAFKQPSRVTANMQIAYTWSSLVKTTLTMTNLIDRCYQRGYAWDYPHVCAYSSLPSSFLPPTGNYTPAVAPPQLKYPYAVWLNNNNTGFVNTTLPFQAALDVQFKLR
ncbi:MAG: TonB-dependent receptor [Candidatus Eremiobacteraeota bacterium]|nr:TonB-dependent receptor [Candidatus Eremiobacteraeota bacterium]